MLHTLAINIVTFLLDRLHFPSASLINILHLIFFPESIAVTFPFKDAPGTDFLMKPGIRGAVMYALIV